MGVLYIDRGFISLNGVDVLDVENIQLRQADGTKAVPTMTRNRRTKGFVKGNREISLSFSVAVQSALGSPKIESIDFDSNNAAMTFEHGGDRYSVVGLNFVDTDQSASGVGSEGKKSFNMVGTDVIDQVGNSALFPTTLSSNT